MNMMLQTVEWIRNPEEHLGLAHMVAARFIRRTERVKDTIEYSLACEALLLICRSYQPEMGTFANVAYTAMTNKIIDYKRRAKRKKRLADFEDLDDKGWREIEIEQLWPDEADFLGWLKKISWTDEERTDLEVLLAVHFKQEKVADIAEQMGVTRPTVYLKLNRISDKIREKYKDAA